MWGRFGLGPAAMQFSWKYALIFPLALPLAALAVLARPPAESDVNHTRYLRIAVDPSGERGFDVGAALAAMLSRPPGLPACLDDGRPCGVSGLVALAQSQPERTDILGAVARGEIETGLAPADRVYAARCQPTQGVPPAELSVIGEIYNEALHIVARTRIDDVAGLKGKRVAIGAPGSDERRLAERVLSAYGLTLRQVRGVDLGGAVALAALADGRIDALFRIAAVPDAGIADLAAGAVEGLHLLPVTGEAASRLSGLHPFGSTGQIADGAYEGLEGVPTLMQPIVWVAGPALPAGLAPKLARALASRPNREAMVRGDRGFTLLRPVALRMPAPLHPGLEGIYAEPAPIVMACPRGGPR